MRTKEIYTFIIAIGIFVNYSLLAGQGVGGRILTVNEAFFPDTYDPVTSKGLAGKRMVELIYDALYSADINNKIIPQIAKGYPEPADDNKSVLVTIREDALWSDGEPITAEDVRFTWQISTSRNSMSDVRWMFSAIEDIQLVAGNKKQFRVFWNRIIVRKTEVYLDFFLIPKHMIGDENIETGLQGSHPYCSDPVGSGAYTFDRFSSTNMQIVLNKNENVLEEFNPIFDNIYINQNQFISGWLNLLQSKRIDLVPFIPLSDYQMARNDLGIQLAPYRSFEIESLLFNCNNELLRLKEFRQAICYAINKELLFESVYDNHGEILTGPFPSSVPGWPSDVSIYEYYPDTAKQMLYDIGCRDVDGDGILELNGKPLQLQLIYRAEVGDVKQQLIVNSITDALADIGINIIPDLASPILYDNKVSYHHEYDIALRKEVFMRNFNIVPYYHSSENYSGGKNYMNFSDDNLDEILSVLSESGDINIIKSMRANAHRLIHEQAPALFLWNVENYAAYQSKLQGIRIDPYYFYTTIHTWREMNE